MIRKGDRIEMIDDRRWVVHVHTHGSRNLLSSRHYKKGTCGVALTEPCSTNQYTIVDVLFDDGCTAYGCTTSHWALCEPEQLTLDFTPRPRPRPRPRVQLSVDDRWFRMRQEPARLWRYDYMSRLESGSLTGERYDAGFHN